MARNTKFSIGQGETFRLLINLTLMDSGSTPLDITDYNFSGSIRETYSSDIVSTRFSFEKNLPYQSGSLYITLPATETAILGAQDYVYDILMVSGSNVRRFLEGQFIVRPSVTR